MVDGRADGLDVFARRKHGLGGHAEGHEHARNGRVYARIEEEKPHYGAQAEVEDLALDPHVSAHEQHQQAARGVEQEDGLEMRGIEGRDDDDAADVVNHGERRQEDFQRDGHAAAKHGEYAKREGNVRGHRDGGAVAVARAVSHEEVDGHGENHAADGAHDGQQRLPDGRQLADEHLALDFQPYAEEKDGHQCVVDKLQERHRAPGMAEHVEVAHLQTYALVPKVRVEVRQPGDVGHHEGQDRGKNQYVAARGMAAESLACGKKYAMRLLKRR